MISRLKTFVFTTLTLVLLLCVFGQVLLRYLTDAPIAWTEELSRYTFIWLVMLGAAEGSYRAGHFAIDLVTRRLEGRAARGYRAFLAGLEGVAYAVLAYSGAVLLPIVAGQTSITLGVPLTVAYAAIPVGFALMALVSWVRCARYFTARATAGFTEELAS
ncbi:TRAP transporter small permease subunit [Xylophilus rhododendri]|uniref:TRAP transporter small permease protein n=1 Tax=Xylophilus rhododendri TaxID=2697032 RepID=A0A857JB84_9BURK|nr:TRAP transporter small permease [Xylophilus rhododendri]QHJ01281.1 TRAP transporter small permease subunit [Xylophilus rhododendri]